MEDKVMRRNNRYTTEQIVNKLRQADVELAKGQSIAVVCKGLGITAPRRRQLDGFNRRRLRRDGFQSRQRRRQSACTLRIPPGWNGTR